MSQKFDVAIQEMRDLGYLLKPYSFPIVPLTEEFEIQILKSRHFDFDGLELTVSFSCSEFEGRHLETIQIQSIYSCFLPFFVVCKIAVAFLGKNNLLYNEFVKSGNKIYCWSVRYEGKEAIEPPTSYNKTFYEDFEYYVMEQ